MRETDPTDTMLDSLEMRQRSEIAIADASFGRKEAVSAGILVTYFQRSRSLATITVSRLDVWPVSYGRYGQLGQYYSITFYRPFFRFC
jgi:hypothetical protein